MVTKTGKPHIYSLYAPDDPLPVVFDSPHSGQIYPADFNYHCHFESLQRVEDAHVHTLFKEAPKHSAYLLCAEFPRSYVDVNRAIDDIDETLFEGEWPDEEFGKIVPSSRSDSGIGLISRILKPGMPIYNRTLPPEEIMARIKKYYEPYHNTLRTILDQSYYNHGQFWHINLHSMPSKSAFPKRSSSLINKMVQPSDIVLGDRDGSTCSRDFMNGLRDFWKNLGYRVSINDPFKGVELISRYSQPTRGRNSVQIEINRALYMNESTGEKKSCFGAFQDHCTDMIRYASSFSRQKVTQIAAD